MLITQEMTLDICRENKYKVILAKQCDSQSRYLKVTVKEDGEELFITSGSTVLISARRPDDSSASFLGNVNGDGTVTVPLAYWILEQDGIVPCDINIIQDNRKLSTMSFLLDVERSANVGDDIEQDENYDILIQLIEDVRQTADDVTREYEQSASRLMNTYEASMAAAIAECEAAVEAVSLVSGPFYINDMDNNTQYYANIVVTGGKPKLLYDVLQT